MKRTLGAFVVTLVLLLSVAPGTIALLPIRECGTFVPTGWSTVRHMWTGFWTFRTSYGFTPVYNLTARGVTASHARPFSLVVSQKNLRHYQGYTCRWRFNDGAYDVSCTKGSLVIHWLGGE